MRRECTPSRAQVLDNLGAPYRRELELRARRSLPLEDRLAVVAAVAPGTAQAALNALAGPTQIEPAKKQQIADSFTNERDYPCYFVVNTTSKKY